MSIITAIVIVISILIICITTYFGSSNCEKQEIVILKERLSFTDIKLKYKDNILSEKNRECERLATLLKEVLDKSQQYNINANLKT